MSHWIWALVVFGCLVWYTLVSIYVAIKGEFALVKLVGNAIDIACKGLRC